MKITKRSVALVVAIALLIGCAAGGTMAWLMMKTETITNTFTVGNINITLNETTGVNYKMVPGATITKDPEVKVLANSENCWLFVKVEESANFDTYMEYEMATGWNELTSENGVYYREVAANNADQPFDVIKGDTITVKDTLTKSDMDAASSQTLKLTAYAIQKEGFGTAELAWDEAENATIPTPPTP